jgi:hypothetical protein
MLTGANFLNLALPKFIFSLLPPRDNGFCYALCAMLYAFSVASRPEGRSSNLKACSADPRALQRHSGSETDRQGRGVPMYKFEKDSPASFHF